NSVYVDCREIREITSLDLMAVGKLIKKLKSDGRKFHLVNPNEAIEESLKKSGYAEHIARMDSSGAPGDSRASTKAPS
ncbi:MAG TPA: STAS domain-containing protein, partial [bacterium]|nr:STAS domain-containing protein [bacterium]